MRVVHCKREPYTHYIGRPSPLGNPWSHKPSSVPGIILVPTRQMAISRFEQWARYDCHILELIDALPEDAVLGCWCDPEPCHGNVIITLWKELHGQV